MHMIEDTYIKNDGIQVGSNIRKIRISKGMKTSELVTKANLLGANMTIFSLSKIEANTQHIRATQLKAIKEALGCSYSDLLE